MIPPVLAIHNVLDSSGIGVQGVCTFTSGVDGVVSGSIFFTRSGTGTFQVRGVPINQQSGALNLLNNLSLSTSGLANIETQTQRSLALSGLVEGDPMFKLVRAATMGIVDEMVTQLNAIRARVSGLTPLVGGTVFNTVKANAVMRILSGFVD